MDALDRLAVPAADLLARVDTALATTGAPAEHPVWPLLRRVGVLPGDAVRAVAALRSGPPAAAEPALRRLAQAYGDAQVSASDPVPWEGAGAEAFAAHRGVLVAHLTQGEESLSGRLAATAGYADALAGWMAQTRAELARALASVLGSAQAVSLVAGPLDGPLDRPPDGPVDGLPWARAVPAADIAVRVLSAVAQAYDRADELRREWAPRLTELPWRPAVGTERAAGTGPAVRTGAGPRLGG